MILFIAQTSPNPDADGAQQALDMIETSVGLSKATADSWNEVWTTIFDPAAPLWYGLVKLGLTLAAGSIIFLALTTGKEVIEKQSWSELVAMFVWPLVIALFLGGNGNLLSRTVLLTRSIGNQEVRAILNAQIGDLSFQSAINQVMHASIAKQRIENLHDECKRRGPEEMLQCWQSKEAQIQSIIDDTRTKSGDIVGNFQKIADSITTFVSSLSVGSVFRATAIPIVRLILSSLQWCFVNILEASLVLTGLFAPIAMGLSLLPFQGRPIWAWATGFLSLFGIQMAYNIIVGLMATILVKSGAELASDIAFMLFVSIFAPALAVAIAGGGGIAIYNTISNKATEMKNTLARTASVLVGRLA